MFKSIGFVDWSKNNIKNKIIIIDDDFIETTFIPLFKYNFDMHAFAEKIFSVYSKRNLNVAANFILYMKYYEKMYYQNISDQLFLYEQSNKDFKKYKVDIMRLLLLV